MALATHHSRKKRENSHWKYLGSAQVCHRALAGKRESKERLPISRNSMSRTQAHQAPASRDREGLWMCAQWNTTASHSKVTERETGSSLALAARSKHRLMVPALNSCRQGWSHLGVLQKAASVWRKTAMARALVEKEYNFPISNTVLLMPFPSNPDPLKTTENSRNSKMSVITMVCHDTGLRLSSPS